MNIILSLLEKNTDKREQRTLLREAGELFGQMDFLLASLLKLSRLDAGIVIFKKEQVDISNLISVSLRPFLISMELHNIQIQTDIPEGIKISGDFKWLSEAFQNVIKNSIESVGDLKRKIYRIYLSVSIVGKMQMPRGMESDLPFAGLLSCGRAGLLPLKIIRRAELYFMSVF